MRIWAYRAIVLAMLCVVASLAMINPTIINPADGGPKQRYAAGVVDRLQMDVGEGGIGETYFAVIKLDSGELVTVDSQSWAYFLWHHHAIGRRVQIRYSQHGFWQRETMIHNIVPIGD